MTHEELLAKIDEEGEFLVQHFDSRPTFVSALRAVVELHKWEDKHRGMRIKQRCPECGFAYPCPTIEAITKEIK